MSSQRSLSAEETHLREITSGSSDLESKGSEPSVSSNSQTPLVNRVRNRRRRVDSIDSARELNKALDIARGDSLASARDVSAELAQIGSFDLNISSWGNRHVHQRFVFDDDKTDDGYLALAEEIIADRRVNIQKIQRLANKDFDTLPECDKQFALSIAFIFMKTSRETATMTQEELDVAAANSGRFPHLHFGTDEETPAEETVIKASDPGLQGFQQRRALIQARLAPGVNLPGRRRKTSMAAVADISGIDSFTRLIETNSAVSAAIELLQEQESASSEATN
jgi:hypothetical protein